MGRSEEIDSLNKKSSDAELDYDYPITIFMTRYGGTFEGGVWAALPLDFVDDMAALEDAQGGDYDCQEFWLNPPCPVGVGDGPESALADLIKTQR